MKRILVLAFLTAIGFACTKESKTSTKEYCWQCNTRVVTTATGMPAQTSNSVMDKCNMTEVQASEMEKAGTSQTTSTTSGITVVMKYTTNCTKR